MLLQQTAFDGLGTAWAANIENLKLQPSSGASAVAVAVPLHSIASPIYLTAQTLIQHVAYSLSDKLFTYSPETFDLDLAVRNWASIHAPNSNGYTTEVCAMETRLGAASIALGYIFSRDFDLKKRHIPQSVIASSSSLKYFYPALKELSHLRAIASPFVAHIAAADYIGGSLNRLVTDYVSAQTLADDLGFALVSSSSAYEAQHMSLFSTLLASILPTFHIYDGVSIARETVKINDMLDQVALYGAYKTITHELSGASGKASDVESRACRLLRAFNGELGTAYDFFEYSGHESPEMVLVVIGSVESSIASQVSHSIGLNGTKIGFLNVRLYRPFIESAFFKALPRSVRVIGVLGQVENKVDVADSSIFSALYLDILAAVTFSNNMKRPPHVVDIKYAKGHLWSTKSMINIFLNLLTGQSKTIKSADAQERIERYLNDLNSIPQPQQYIFWDNDDSVSAKIPSIIGQLLSADPTSNVTISTSYDNYKQGGIVRTDIRTSKDTIDFPHPIEKADVIFIGNEKFLNELNFIGQLKPGGICLLKLPGYKEADLEKRLPAAFRQAAMDNKYRIIAVDPLGNPASAENTDSETLISVLAFLTTARQDLLNLGPEQAFKSDSKQVLNNSINQELEKIIHEVPVSESWAAATLEGEVSDLPSMSNANSFVKFDKSETEPISVLRDWETAAKSLLFKEAFGTKTDLRPDLPAKTWTVHVKENRRLTPLTYDRNIFHIEFDLGDSGLKYDIGEALGIHAENDEDEVKDFMKFYGLNPEEVVEVPSREDSSAWEARTVYQSLIQNIDIFGRPPKKFYEALAEFAEDDKERKELLTLGGPEGAVEFKRRAEVETVTFADVLLEFPSAHPSFHDIARIVSPMKRREYSIASSQRVTPTSVALMIVVVNWTDPRGRSRFGQATRYLNKLKVGSPVTVSVKPSVMKLPLKSTQPIIMAGLGTGLAPFRAFVQYRAWQKAQGIEIGSVLLYMGSRHQREEYCYGEEWEAYQDAGVITLLGRAFSRDQPQKIYIQDRMRQTMNDIIQAYINEEGAFYLCGPTWPVPDVTNVLQEAISRHAATVGKKIDSRREIERLKEEGRYVLEVY
ncbi:MAG: hypothetical protein M1829_005042 [Trizodia sp. TS-e1964]|nr:MAG: hypothetical protein M1829_005042 [Trizodia sp. TS-e1964]